jgi:hypothetical protein
MTEPSPIIQRAANHALALLTSMGAHTEENPHPVIQDLRKTRYLPSEELWESSITKEPIPHEPSTHSRLHDPVDHVEAIPA